MTKSSDASSLFMMRSTPSANAAFPDRRILATMSSLQNPSHKWGTGALLEILGLGQGARREQILAGSVTDEQRGPSAKDLQPSGRSSGGLLAALLLSHRTRGYAPSLLLASNPPELRAPILHL